MVMGRRKPQIPAKVCLQAKRAPNPFQPLPNLRFRFFWLRRRHPLPPLPHACFLNAGAGRGQTAPAANLQAAQQQQRPPAGMQQLQRHGEKKVGQSGHETEALAVPHPNRRPWGEKPSWREGGQQAAARRGNGECATSVSLSPPRNPTASDSAG
jgi:hypothetical protein